MDSKRLIAVMFLCSGLFWASCRAERALWIELKEDGRPTSTIAITEGVARQLLEKSQVNVSFSEEGKEGLVTREMLRDVLSGERSSITVDDGHGEEARVYMKSLSSPGAKSGQGHLVLEVYKSGTQTFRIALPDVEIEQGDDKGDEFVKVSFGWKALLPFLAKSGGTVYINDVNEDTEVWIFAE